MGGVGGGRRRHTALSQSNDRLALIACRTAKSRQPGDCGMDTSALTAKDLLSELCRHSGTHCVGSPAWLGEMVRQTICALTDRGKAPVAGLERPHMAGFR